MDVKEALKRTTTAAVVFAAMTAFIMRHAEAQDAACAPGPMKEVVTRDDITHHGLSRLSDVFSMSTRWHAASVDGYHWSAAPTGLNSDNERWTVFVDDVPVATRLIGRNQINALPIPIFDVECIELVAGPDLRHPVLSQGGSIRIHTRRPDFGLSFEAAGAAGNEINDPGPFRYTSPELPNVDRIGPVGTVGVAVDASAWAARASGRLEEFHVTDDVLIERLRHLYNADSKPRIKAQSVALTGSIGPASAQHRLVGGNSRTADLAFFPAVGYEIPTDHRLVFVGGSGHAALPNGRILYAASYARGDLGVRPNRGNVDLDWHQDRATFDAEARIRAVRFGGGLRSSSVHTTVPLAEPSILTTRLFGGVNLGIIPQWHQDLVLEWKQRGDRGSVAAYVATDVRVSERHRLTLNGSYGIFLADDQDLWIWLRRGYRLPVPDPTRQRVLAYEPLPRLATADASWTALVTDGLQIGVRSFFRRTENDYNPRYDIFYDDETTGFDVTTYVVDQVAGSTVGGSASIDLTIDPWLRQRITYAFEAVVRGDAAYREPRRRVPAHRVTFTATAAPADRFRLSMLVRYTSPTRWPAYAGAADQSGGAYQWQLPEYVLVDVAASKRLWTDHLIVSLALKNVLNEPLRYHPAGAVWYMAFRFSAQIKFTSDTGF